MEAPIVSPDTIQDTVKQAAADVKSIPADQIDSTFKSDSIGTHSYSCNTAQP